MQKYKSHRIVEAAKITNIEQIEHNHTKITFEIPNNEDDNIILDNTKDLVGKPTPEVGWYIIKYPDGYFSYIPAKSFEEGYSIYTEQETEIKQDRT